MSLLKVSPKPQPKVFDHISYSAVSTFQTCPLRFYFRYMIELPEETISSSLVMGTALHRAIQRHFERLLVGEMGSDLDSLMDAFKDGWAEHSKKRIAYSKGEDRDKLNLMAIRLLTTFLQSDFSKQRGVILGVEEELRGQIIDGCPDLLARVDLIVDADRELEVWDFKTSRCAWNDFKAGDLAPQLHLYSELVKVMADGKPIKLYFAVLTKTKTPVLQVHEVPCDVRDVLRTKKTVERVWQAIRSGHFYPNPSPMNCGSCPYRKPCRAWTG
jgi:CRISPR/Cas system-associated exonuclease Cas4 (RecB family)